MRRILTIAVVTLLLAGCATRPPLAVIHRHAPNPAARLRGTPNLALGPSAEHLYIAQDFTYRLPPLSAPLGYRVDEISHFAITSFDDQSFFDALGGSYYRTGSEYRTGVLLR